MAKANNITIIHHKIAELMLDIEHYEKAVEVARKDIEILYQVLKALEREPFSYKK